MEQNQLIVRSSPFQFLKKLFVLEFFFAILPFFIAWIIDILIYNISDSYQRNSLSTTLSFNLFAVLIFTAIQVLIIAVAFIAWYFPVYVVNKDEIRHQRGRILGNVRLAKSERIEKVSIVQGRLAKTFNYGNLVINSNNKQTKLKDIHEPHQVRDQINEIIAFEKNETYFLEPRSANVLVSEGENQNVEFKSSFVWDYYQLRANKSLHEPVMKTIVAFLNSFGGFLLIGVDDNGEVLGLDPDYQTLRKPNSDGFETSFNMAFNKMVGVEYRQYVDLTFPEINGQEICLIKVNPSPQPAYLQHKDAEKFFIRAGNASQSLTISQATLYIKQRFQ